MTCTKPKSHSRQHSCKRIGSTAQAEAGMPEQDCIGMGVQAGHVQLANEVR